MKRIMNKTMAFTIVILMALSSCKHHMSTDASEWTLNSETSKISIITTKNNKISEVSEFKVFSGNINKNNYLNIEIDLKSLETNIPIRNERIQKYLFQTDIYPSADIHTQLKPDDLNLGVHNITFDVDLHGVSGILNAEFLVSELDGDKIISLNTPLIIKAEDFALDQGITTLRKLAKLESINFTVPINLTLSFSAQ